MQQKKYQKTLPNILSGLLKLTYSYAFRKILLYPTPTPDYSSKIRHYDSECQAIQHIISVMAIPFDRKKMSSFFMIKSYNQNLPLRSKSACLTNNASCPKIKKLRRTNTLNRSLAISDVKTFSMISSVNKENQLKELFSRVKDIAQNLMGNSCTVDKTKTKNKNEELSVKLNKKKSIFNQICTLQKQMNELIDNTGQKIHDKTLNTTSSSICGINQKQKIRNSGVKRVQFMSRF